MKINEDIIELILRDHRPLKKLIEVLKDSAKNRLVKQDQFEEFAKLLMAHTKAEEKSLYIQMKELSDLRMESLEAETEHMIAENLIHEINASPDDDQWNAKVKVLAELVEHHIEEEETEMLEKVRAQMEFETRKAIGMVYAQIKSDLDRLQRPLIKPEQGNSFYTFN